MNASVLILIQEFKAVASEMDELEFRDIFELKALLAHQHSNSNVQIEISDI